MCNWKIYIHIETVKHIDTSIQFLISAGCWKDKAQQNYNCPGKFVWCEGKNVKIFKDNVYGVFSVFLPPRDFAVFDSQFLLGYAQTAKHWFIF